MMKKLLMCLLALLMCTTGVMAEETAHTFEEVWFYGNIAVRQSGLYGLLDYDGNTLLPCEWADMGQPWLNVVGVQDAETGFWGAVDMTGQVIVPFEWDYVSVISDDRDPNDYWFWVEQDGLVGALAADGTQLLPCEFNYVGQMGSEPYPLFGDVGDSEDNRRYFALLPDGTVEEREEASFGWTFSDTGWQPPEGYSKKDVNITRDLCVIRSEADGLCYVVHADGTLRSPEGWEDIRPFAWCEEDGQLVAYAPVMRDGKWGFINQEGTLVIPCQYDRVGVYFRENRASVGVGTPEDGERFWIDTQGNRLYDHPWAEATHYHRGVSLVKDESGLWGMIDLEGNVLVPCQWRDVSHSWLLPFAHGDVMGVVSEDNLVGFVNTAGEMVIPYQFDRTLLGWNNYAAGMGNASIRGDRVVVWYRGELMVFAADGTQIY